MKKRKYLYRLATIMILALVVPVILFFNFFWKKSFHEMEETNEVFYEKRLEAYISLYDQKIKELATFTAAISADSKKPGNGLWIGAEGLKENYFQYYMVTKELEEKYTRYDVSEWGVYIYDLKKFIQPGATMSFESFIDRYASTEEDKEQLEEFLSVNNYSNTKIIYNTTNFSGNYDGNLLVGICTRIGANNDSALIYFRLSTTDIEDSLAIIDNQGIEYYLLDKSENRILLAWGDTVGENAEAVLNNEVWREAAGVKQKVMYQKESAYTHLNLVAYVSEDSIQGNIMDYAHDMRTLLTFTIILLLLICLAALYVAYKPIQELTSELDYSEGGEFELIRNVLYDRHIRIEEQEMLIMDLLLNHLIYGVPISEKRLKRLGLEEAMHYYCVFLLDGYVLVSSESEKIIKDIEQTFQSRLFVTDWQGEERSILILFTRDSDIAAVGEYLSRWLEECYISDCALYSGKVVEKLDDIRLSLRSCFEQIKKKNVKEQKEKDDINIQTPKEKQNVKMKEEILAYLELNYRDANLSQVQVADHFRISNYTLSRLFKNQVGVGFAEYLVSKRLECAKELLLTTSYSVQEISVMAGFSSVNYFSRTFKIYVGMSPSAFRVVEKNL